MLTSLQIPESVRIASPRSGSAPEGRRTTFEANDGSRVADQQVRTLLSRTFLPPLKTSLVSPKSACAMLCALAAFISGCAASQKPRARAFPWANANNVRPLAPEKTSSEVSNEDLFADLGLAVPAPPSLVAGTPSGPSRPRVVVVSTGNNNASQVPEVPMIAPQLSPQQTAAAQQQTTASVSVAMKNIEASQGRSLNPTQSDLASKVRSFLAEAREAAHVGDWTRASSAAKKAEVLSQELASSL